MKIESRDYINQSAVKKYNELWKQIVENQNGTLNKMQVMRELADYSMVMEYAAKVYCHVTGNKISKPNTLPNEVMNAADEHYEEMWKGFLSDEFEEVTIKLDYVWVPVSERLPENSGKYLVCIPTYTGKEPFNEVAISTFYDTVAEPHFSLSQATHWMSLPSAPRGA